MLMLSLVASATGGCAITGRKKPKRPPRVMTEAVKRSLDYAFNETWAGKHIYIRPNFYLPIGIEQVGTCPAEVVSEGALRKRFMYSAVAPSIASVYAELDDTHTIIVKITYFPLDNMEDKKSSTDRASFEYEYVVTKGELIRISETRARQ